jgi:hypothetical protein
MRIKCSAMYVCVHVFAPEFCNNNFSFRSMYSMKYGMMDGRLELPPSGRCSESCRLGLHAMNKWRKNLCSRDECMQVRYSSISLADHGGDEDEDEDEGEE